ncbi:histone-fold-containing protein [Dichomitus squalens]|uniref:Histone-fold-containing protein n=1 Tax=Dichomitus squalens TaxID=114155 RepID=A0A4Q9PEX8_9APHY|nr:histone-fold-containing protein [Dichomitus squalens]
MKNKNKSTKFPVARIKRIMQKDEEVGKVAQATPVVICMSCSAPLFGPKALELFLAMIVEESSNVTVERGSKRVEAYHLKHAIETVDMLDFLKEIVEAVPDPSAGGTIDVEAENAEARAKKRGKGKDKAEKKERAEKAENGDGAKPKRRSRKKAAVKEEVVEEEEEAREEMDVEEDEEEGRRKREDDDDDWEG